MIKSLTAEKESLTRELSKIRDSNLVLTTRLQDAQLIGSNLKDQLTKEAEHRVELEKMIRVHQKFNGGVQDASELKQLPSSSSAVEAEKRLTDL